MARGDVVVFNEALAYMIDGGWASSDNVKIALLDNTTAPAQTSGTPALGDYTQMETAGSYTTGGTSLGSISALVTQSGAVMTFDSTTNPSWSQNAGNGTDAYWGLIYNDTQAGDPAIAYVDLGGPVDMTAGDLTITWNGSGIFTITNS